MHIELDAHSNRSITIPSTIAHKLVMDSRQSRNTSEARMRIMGRAHGGRHSRRLEQEQHLQHRPAHQNLRIQLRPSHVLDMAMDSRLWNHNSRRDSPVPEPHIGTHRSGGVQSEAPAPEPPNSAQEHSLNTSCTQSHDRARQSREQAAVVLQ